LGIVKADVKWASDELIVVLGQLSAQQAAGVARIVQAELEGKPLSALLDCPDQICTSTTYYGSGKRGGWRGKPEFRQAVELARRDYRAWMLEHSTSEALALLASTTPDAVMALRQQIVGNASAVAVLEAALNSDKPALRKRAARALGETQLEIVVGPLWRRYEIEDDLGVLDEIVWALGQVAGSRDGDRRAASKAVLDRGSTETASKQSVAIGDFGDVTEREQDAIERALVQEAQGGSQAQ
jgi:hypothetical protein